MENLQWIKRRYGCLSIYKDYILVLLFMRYVTDKYYGKKDALIDVPEGGSFHDLSKLKGDKEIGNKMRKRPGYRKLY